MSSLRLCQSPALSTAPEQCLQRLALRGVEIVGLVFAIEREQPELQALCMPFDEVVDELAGDAQLWRDHRQLVRGEPSGLQDLALVGFDFARGPMRGEANHQ